MEEVLGDMVHGRVPGDPRPVRPNTGDRPGPDTPVVTEAVLRRRVVETGDEEALSRGLDGTVRVWGGPSRLLAGPDRPKETRDPGSVGEDRHGPSPRLSRSTRHDVGQGEGRVVVETVSVPTEDGGTVSVHVRDDRVDGPLSLGSCPRPSGSPEALRSVSPTVVVVESLQSRSPTPEWSLRRSGDDSDDGPGVRRRPDVDLPSSPSPASEVPQGV